MHAKHESNHANYGRDYNVLINSKSVLNSAHVSRFPAILRRISNTVCCVPLTMAWAVDGAD